MLKTALALRQLPIKMSARWLSSCSGGIRVRKKMSEDDINDRRRTNIGRKIRAEYQVLDCYDDSFLKPERWGSENLEDLKSFLNDLKKFNRKNGIVPLPQHKRELPVRKYDYIPDSRKPRIDNTGVIESAQLAVKEYNKQHGSSLEFVSVLSVKVRSFGGDCNFVIQTRDPAAAGVSIKLDARCCWTRGRVIQVLLQRPAPSIKLIRKDENNKNGVGAAKALLYANLRNCPLITRRLGLKREDVHYGYLRGSVLNLSLDDDSLMSVAQFAVEQRPNVHLLRVTGAWREEIGHLTWIEEMADRRYLYHVIFEALEVGHERRFYSAISVNAEGEAPKLVDLVDLDTRKPTIK